MSMNQIDLSGINLPAGVRVAGWRETSQTNAVGNVQQGLAFVLQTSSGGQTTVFIPYALLHSTDAIAAAFTERIEQIRAIENLSS